MHWQGAPAPNLRRLRSTHEVEGLMERRQETRMDDSELQEFFRNIEEAFIRKFQRDMPGEARRYLNLAEQVVRSGEQELRNESSREGLRS
jgi:replication-associated recombination protein RarA